ncbi:fimbria biosynthesis transcriptional regulator FimW [Salmonella enterica]|nr:fimbria biosynthesis transcriptional regulator FimW [Salmonella enterica]
MLRIAIKEHNRHFEHGLKIIMARLVNQWQQKIYFLPPEEIDNADVPFLALDDDWFSAGCYQIPMHTQHQLRVIICNEYDKEKLMFRPCLYMLPHIYRGDDIEEITHKRILILHKRALRHSVPSTICHYCTTRHFSVTERHLLKLIASGYHLSKTAALLSFSEEQIKSLRRSILRKLHVKTEQQFLQYISVNLHFLISQ